MYKISQSKSKAIKLEERLFGDLEIEERKHLQEWIAANPEMLNNEELLIIQKEFDGFNDTHERLDLLALDKEGNLVIIENKLDDTGRNVVWQALKYTSYCSTLKTSQIIQIYQQYLDQYFTGENAKENILEFLGREEDDLLLNRGDQRIIFVANKFRKEVTSTVLWLMEHNIQIQCFRASPYSFDDDIFLQMEQIIPVPEVKEYMISAREKEDEEKSKSAAVAEKEALLIEFWGKLKDDLKQHNIDYLERVAAKPSFDIGFWKGEGKFAFCIGKGFTIRVELYIPNDKEKTYIDSMLKHKDDINNAFGDTIIWERLENKKASRIKYEVHADNLDKTDGKLSDKENWEARIQWYRESMLKFYEAISPVWQKVQKG